MHILMSVQQNKTEENLEEGWLWNTTQKEIQVRSSSHHFFHSHLQAKIM